jgi:hypothetical protein
MASMWGKTTFGDSVGCSTGSLLMGDFGDDTIADSRKATVSFNGALEQINTRSRPWDASAKVAVDFHQPDPSQTRRRPKLDKLLLEPLQIGKRKVPSAAHLQETHKFVGTHAPIAISIKKTQKLLSTKMILVRKILLKKRRHHRQFFGTEPAVAIAINQGKELTQNMVSL